MYYIRLEHNHVLGPPFNAFVFDPYVNNYFPKKLSINVMIDRCFYSGLRFSNISKGLLWFFFKTIWDKAFKNGPSKIF